MKRILIIAAVLFIVSTGLLNAQTATKTTTRQVSQQARIADGVSDKELTRHETKRLEREQRKIQHDKKVAKSDGTVSPEEKKLLRHEQNRANRHIRRQKNDAQERGL
jgi:tellurite resistance protein